MALTRVTETGNITVDGNVGIETGTVTPRDAGASTLQIGGNGTRSAIKMHTSSSGTGSTDGLFLGYDSGPDFYILNSEANGEVKIGTNNSPGRLVIDASGRVTKPAHPAFFAVGNAGQTSYGSGAQIVIVNEQWDRNNNFSTSTGRFTAPVTGAYMFTYGFYSYEASKQFAIKLNNSDYVPSDTAGLIDAKNTSEMCNGTMLLYLTANDYVTVGYRSGNSGSVYLNHCWFGGYLIG